MRKEFCKVSKGKGRGYEDKQFSEDQFAKGTETKSGIAQRGRRAGSRAKFTRDIAWDEIAKLAGSVEGPDDWALEHNHYIHGSPKRNVASRQ